MEGAMSIVGFGLGSQAGFESGVTAVDTATASSGEHDTSLDCANAEADEIARAKLASSTRGNSFLSTIDRELPSL
jgi:hypothetical protein